MESTHTLVTETERDIFRDTAVKIWEPKTFMIWSRQGTTR